MTESDVQKLFLTKLNVRIGPEMSRYVLHQFMNGEAAAGHIPVMGGDTRTGVPLRSFVDPADFLSGKDHPEKDLSELDTGDKHLH